VMPLTMSSLMRRPFATRPFLKGFDIQRFHPTRLIVVFFIMDSLMAFLDHTFIIMLIRINSSLSLVNFVLPFFVLSFLLATSGLDHNKPGVEVLILLFENLHGFFH
jgi:hypothetical protein